MILGRAGVKEGAQVLRAQRPKSPARQMGRTEQSAGKGSFPKGKPNPAQQHEALQTLFPSLKTSCKVQAPSKAQT